MPQAVRIAIMTSVLVVASIATMLATISGAIAAVDWACRTIGTLPVSMTGAFLAGAIVTHGVHRGMAKGSSRGHRGALPPCP